VRPARAVDLIRSTIPDITDPKRTYEPMRIADGDQQGGKTE